MHASVHDAADGRTASPAALSPLFIPFKGPDSFRNKPSHADGKNQNGKRSDKGNHGSQVRPGKDSHDQVDRSNHGTCEQAERERSEGVSEAVILPEHLTQHHDSDENDRYACDAVRDHDPFRKNSCERIRIPAPCFHSIRDSCRSGQQRYAHRSRFDRPGIVDQAHGSCRKRRKAKADQDRSCQSRRCSEAGRTFDKTGKDKTDQYALKPCVCGDM